MAEEGAKFAVFGRELAEGRALADDLTIKGHDVAFWAVDVTKKAGLKAAIDALAALFGGLQVTVNNAGISGSPNPPIK